MHRPSLPLLWWPLLFSSCFFLLFNTMQLDFALSDFWYKLQGGQWQLQNYWLTEQVLHRGARTLNQLLVLGLIVFTLWQAFVQRKATVNTPTRWSARPLALLCLSLLLSLGVVALIKHSVPMECPWDLQQFGGHLRFTSLWQPWPPGQTMIACFPAGHASVGYAWFGLYFWARQQAPAKAALLLKIVLATGLVLGLAQQLRGAHFISHDIVTAAICWAVSWSIFRLGSPAKTTMLNTDALQTGSVQA